MYNMLMCTAADVKRARRMGLADDYMSANICPRLCRRITRAVGEFGLARAHFHGWASPGYAAESSGTVDPLQTVLNTLSG